MNFHIQPPTIFVGRTDELARIAALLADPTCRLLTLVGPGGIGKTRLALEVVKQILNREDPELTGESSQYAGASVPVDVYYIPLQALISPNLILSAVANAVELQFYSNMDPRQQLFDYLRSKSLLLVLDNFEHLLSGVDLIADILAHAPNTKILVTSRETLNLQEEWVYRMTGMDYPQTEQDPDLKNYGAIRLFIQCARRANPNFSLDAEQHVVLRICQLVEGMPLALEMTAAWLKRLPLHEILQHVERGSEIFEHPARNVPSRHRSMRVVFEDSWNLLNDTERDIFKKLSVFRGGFRWEAGQSVTGATLGILSALVDKSLLQVDTTGRYHVHELLRQYAEEKLSVSPQDNELVNGLHGDYYANFMKRQWTRLTSRQQLAALESIETELDNVLVAWNYALRQRATVTIRMFIPSLSWFLYWRYRYPQAMELLSQAIETLQSAPLDLDTSAVVGTLMARLAWFYNIVGSAAKGKALLDSALPLLRTSGSPDEWIVAFHGLTFVSWALNQIPDARAAAQDGLNVASDIGDSWWKAWFLYLLGALAGVLGDYDEEKRLGTAAQSLIETQGELWLSACNSVFVLAEAALELGDYAEANRLTQKGMRLFKEFGHLWGIAECYANLGNIAVVRGKFDEARYYYQQRLRMFTESGLQLFRVLDSLVMVAKLLIAENNKPKAIELLAFVHQHTDTEQVTRFHVGELLVKLRDELPPETIKLSSARGKSLNLESIVADILNDAEAAHASQDGSPLLSESLTDREQEILRLIAAGFSNGEIAGQLFLAISTVKWYLREIFSKLHAKSRTQAVARARELKLLD